MKTERQTKIDQLKTGIKATHLAIEAAINVEQRVTLYGELSDMLMNLENLKMNKTGSEYFSFIRHNGYNRKQRKQMGLR